MLHRQVVSEWRGGQYESSDVRGAKTRHSLERRHRRESRFTSRVVEIETELGSESLLDVLRSLGWITPVDSLGEIRRHLDRIPERAHRIENRVGSTIHLHDAGDRRLRPVVLVVDVIEHFLPTIVLDVDVDVRSFCLTIDSDLGEKSLEQKPVLHRVDGGDGQTVGDRGVRGAATSLAEDSLFTSEIHRVPHHKEESGEAEIADDSQFVPELRGLLVVDFPPPLVRAGEDSVLQESVVGEPFGNREPRQRRPHPRQAEVALSCDSLALLETRFASLPPLGYLLRRSETPFSIRMQ